MLFSPTIPRYFKPISRQKTAPSDKLTSKKQAGRPAFNFEGGRSMGRLKYVFLPFVFLAMFALPVAVAADGTGMDVSQCLKAGIEAPPNDNCKDCKEKKSHGRGIDDGADFRVYSMMTARSVEELKRACESGKLTIWELAKRDGKLDALKAKLLEGHAAGLDALVKGGVMTAEQRSKILEHLKDELGKR